MDLEKVDLESVGLLRDGGSVDEREARAKNLERAEPTPPAKRGRQFWAIMVALQLSTLIVATETNVAATALPSIMADLQFTRSFDWVLNAYNLMSTAVQPPVGQFSDIFGRKPVLMGGLILYMVGSVLCGAAASANMLVAGRAVQGAGGGIMLVLAELIVSDVVPLNERSSFFGAIMGISALGLVIGPFIGGFITDHASWRWIYYLNIPVGLVALVMLQFCLTMQHRRDPDWRKNVAKIDWGSHWTFIIKRLVLFAAQQNSRWCRKPLMPKRLFNVATSIAFAINFLLAAVQIALPYFFAVFLEALLGHSPEQSGADLVPLFLTFLPVAAVTGAIISKTGRYRFSHIASMGCLSIAMAGCMELNEKTPTYVWMPLLCIASFGIGFAVPSLLPAAQAPLPDSDSAAVTATFSFIRSLGFVWGVFGTTMLFNYKVDRDLWKVKDSAITRLLTNGGAYPKATAEFMSSLSKATKIQVSLLYSESLRIVFQGLFALSLVGLVLSLMEVDIIMRKTLDDAAGFGLEKASQVHTSDDEEGREWDNEATDGMSLANVPSGLNL
ncbi:major facilitator superfamily domain-containing protein [Bisporella sp. PMI_857]|nr:major facilitator superfamily domain-containing protein [Bisporella sp. PMI_857]